MVRDKKDPLSVESFGRLGITLTDCPNCGNQFNATQKPHHSIIVFVGGEIVDSDEPSWFCSSECAVAVAADRNLTAAPNEQHLDWTDDG